jgi:general L-amino acid transport system substrate-binding protein
MNWGKTSCAIVLATGLLTGIGGAPSAKAEGPGSATLDAVLARGQMSCGIAGTVPGFSLPDSQGSCVAWTRIPAAPSAPPCWVT